MQEKMQEKILPPKIKICGLTRDCDIDYINEAQPDYIGFVFAPARREISEKEAQRLRGRIAEGIQAVGVFVDAPIEWVVKLKQEGVIDIAQLHGSETVEYVKRLKEQTDCCMIKAMHPERGSDKSLYEQYEKAGIDYFLFDSHSRIQVGGTGQIFDWNKIPQVSRPWFLAGGLHVGNVESAIVQLRPYALDISSGVETDGFKDREKILEIIRRIRNV